MPLGSRTLAIGLAQSTTFLTEAAEGFDVVLVPVKLATVLCEGCAHAITHIARRFAHFGMISGT